MFPVPVRLFVRRFGSPCCNRMEVPRFHRTADRAGAWNRPTGPDSACPHFLPADLHPAGITMSISMKKAPEPARVVSSMSQLSQISKAAELADAGEVEKAFKLLLALNNPTDAVYNARGVCLMRLGRLDEALRVFRAFVLQSGCVWMRPDLAVIHRVNYATALLLSGLTSGATAILSEVHQEDHPAVVRLRGALDGWVRNLSWWQWLNWKTGVAAAVPVSLPFIPGEFFDPVAGPTPEDDNTVIPFAYPVAEETAGQAAQ